MIQRRCSSSTREIGSLGKKNVSVCMHAGRRVATRASASSSVRAVCDARAREARSRRQRDASKKRMRTCVYARHAESKQKIRFHWVYMIRVNFLGLSVHESAFPSMFSHSELGVSDAVYDLFSVTPCGV